jgi:hypothetical protein
MRGNCGSCGHIEYSTQTLRRYRLVERHADAIARFVARLRTEHDTEDVV